MLRYYRTWNLVVYGYLHTYIYKDMIKYVAPGRKVLSICTVVLISALVHEYIISFAIGFLMPILFIHFAFGSLPISLIRFKHDKTMNFFLIWSLIVGTGIEASFYFMEYFARVNCPIEEKTLSSYLILRMFTCNGLDVNSVFV